MFIIPQRFQLVYGTSGLDAGVRLIPFTITIPVGTIFASTIAGKLRVPPIYLILVGSCLQIIGFSLLGTLPATLEIPRQMYGFEFIAGWGCGMNFSLLFVMIPYVNEKRYHCEFSHIRCQPVCSNQSQLLVWEPEPSFDLLAVP